MTPAEYANLLTAVAHRQLGELGQELGAAFAARLPPLAIDPVRRLACFTGQVAHETGGFRWLTELGAPGYFLKYDGRADLGNTRPGDGYRYRGRGLIQITGRANYTTYGQKLDMDLVGDPDLASRPDAAVAIAAQYWAERGLNRYADSGDVLTITHRINGGANGLADREAMTERAMAFLEALAAPPAATTT